MRFLLSFLITFQIYSLFSLSLSRPAMNRMPVTVMGGRISAVSGNTNSVTSQQPAVDTEKTCIDSYLSCLKEDSNCGENFTNCTNNNLFFSKKGMCASVLLQCNNTGIQTKLFGVSEQEMGTIIKDSNGDDRYAYPKIGTIIGDLIEGARQANMLDKSSCVKKYKQCLKKGDVCGSDFELCTTDKEFKKQKFACESIHDRCPKSAKKELNDIVKDMISEGEQLASINAVSTCYKVADACIKEACLKNPYNCKENTDKQTVKKAKDSFGDADTSSNNTSNQIAEIGELINRQNVKDYVSASCLDKIGRNKSCYITVKNATPKASELNNEENQEEIFSEVYENRINNGMQKKIDEYIEEFNTEAIKVCKSSISSCAMRTCGKGNGAVCYALSFPSSGEKSILNARSDIENSCKSIINLDKACSFVGNIFDFKKGIFVSNSNGNDVFNSIFSDKDPIGVVAELNNKLLSSFSPQQLNAQKKRCTQVAQGCVRSACGNNFENCFRFRDDISTNLAKSSSSSFNKSMNKEFGVLDRTVVIGSCLNTVKSAKTCDNYFNIKIAMETQKDDFGGLRKEWLGAGDMGNIEIQKVDMQGNLICKKTEEDTTESICGGDSFIPVMVDANDQKERSATYTAFTDLIQDLELEAQAKYKAKLVAEQSACIRNNSGGLADANGETASFAWVKLKERSSIDKNYVLNGLKPEAFTPSNDLYGSFCRLKVGINTSDNDLKKYFEQEDKYQEMNTYFALGDSFICGSWMKQETLEKVAKSVGQSKADFETRNDEKKRNWAVAGTALLGMVGGGLGGYFATAALQNRGFLGNKSKSFQYEENESQNKNIVNFNRAIDEKRAAMIEARMQEVGEKADRAKITKEVDAELQKQGIAKKDLQDFNLAKQKGKLSHEQVNWIGSGIGATVLATGASVVTWKAMKDVQDAHKTEIEHETSEKWMEDIRDKIQCIVNGRVVGKYGDVIKLDLNNE